MQPTEERAANSGVHREISLRLFQGIIREWNPAGISPGHLLTSTCVNFV